jgi:hypothetical protein
MQAPFDQNMMDLIDPFHMIYPVAPPPPPPATRRSRRSHRGSRRSHRGSHRGSHHGSRHGSHRRSRRSRSPPPPPPVDTRNTLQRRIDEMRARNEEMMRRQRIHSQYAVGGDNLIFAFFRWLFSGGRRH